MTPDDVLRISAQKVGDEGQRILAKQALFCEDCGEQFHTQTGYLSHILWEHNRQ